MSVSEARDRTGKQPETALEEVLREIADAETRARDSGGQPRHRGGAGEAVTPGKRAREDAVGD
jgi:hypothetical protein